MSFIVLFKFAFLAFMNLIPILSYNYARRIKSIGIKRHSRMQRNLFWGFVVGSFANRISEHFFTEELSAIKDGNLLMESGLFKTILIIHVPTAILTFLLWAISLYLAFSKKNKTLPGAFSKTHRRLGYGIIIGLIITAVTADYVTIATFWKLFS